MTSTSAALVPVFIPATDSRIRAFIDPGSAVVGDPETIEAQPGAGPEADPERVVVDYEGNRFDAENMRRFADRALHAYGRHRTAYPTTARAAVRPSDLMLVGHFRTFDGVLLVREEAREALAQWCSVPTDELDDQLTTSTARHEMVRTVRQMRASGDPAQAVTADFLARRYCI